MNFSLILQVLQLLPSIIAAVQAIEAAIPLPGAGAQKLDLVLGGIAAVSSDAGRIIPAVTALIAKIVSTFNALGIFKKST